MKCPMFDSCTLKTGGCVASLPDNGCYWYRWFKDLIQKTENPWHTGTPTEEGWYLIKYKWDGEIRYIATDTLVKTFVEDSRTLGWQKIEEN